MRVLKGFVKSARAKKVIIKLKDGGELEVRRKDLKRGQKVEIDYDFTKNEIGNIWVEGTRPEAEEPISEPLNISDKVLLLAMDDACPIIKLFDEDEKWQDIPLPLELTQFGGQDTGPSSLPLVEGDQDSDAEDWWALLFN